MNAYWGSGGVAPLILRPRHYMEVSGQLHASATLLPGKERGRYGGEMDITRKWFRIVLFSKPLCI
jgi:hypothetical protein